MKASASGKQHRRTNLATGCAALALLACPGLAHAQKTEENAVESAEDAFGTVVGHEQIGVYDEGNVRGFSPGNAGNFRMEGLYFDIQGSLGSRVIENEIIRVGPAAQGYAFPAPTGIVDLSLRKAGDKLTVSPFSSIDTFGAKVFEVDAQIPLSGKQLGVAAGFGLYDNHYADGTDGKGFNLGIVPRWRPARGIELLAYYNHNEQRDDAVGPIYQADGKFLPPMVEQGRFQGPDWARNTNRSDSLGVLGHAVMGDWTIRAGLFHSQTKSEINYFNLITIHPDSSTDRDVFASPGYHAGSWSGEFRVSRRFSEGPRKHLLTAMLRGRSIDAHYGGGTQISLGTAGLNEIINPPRPALTFGAQSLDETRQLSGGMSYGLSWKGVGEFTIGLQRTHYVKRVAAPGTQIERGESNVTLPSFSAAAPLTRTLSAYGSFVRGLEDSGSAPDYASNANQILPAIRTKQYDLGLRWSPVKDTTLILGYFWISKPYIDFDKSNYFGVLGSETHEGIELSLTSNLTSNLRVVLGGVWQNPQVIAAATIAEPVGKRPVGQTRLRSRFNVNWTLPFAKAVTLDAYVNHDGSAAGTVDNSVFAPASTRWGLGARYKFKISKTPVTARVGLYNVNDVKFWVPVGGGAYAYNTRRNVQAWITADF